MCEKTCKFYIPTWFQSSLLFSSVATFNMEEFKIEEYKPPTTKILFLRNKEYHVFLSFRGKDVRKTLVDHLYEALSAAGLHVFLDSHVLKKGQLIESSLIKAIKSSAILIPIFSKGYADSAWCLKEAAAMVRSGGFIIPLFYHVDPTHVRYPLKDSSDYCRAFKKHHGHSDRYPRKEIEEWQRALEQICSRSGWSMDLTGGFEGQLVKRVVNDVIETLDRIPLEVAKNPVGLESVTNDLIHKFKLNSVESVVIAGLWGIGGIGKTTVAKALYNQVYACFDAASFVVNIRATAGDATGLAKLQKKIFKDLTKSDLEVGSVDEGKNLIRDRLGWKRVLLILDDVDDNKQSNALVGDWLAPGSRVIITSRDKQILNNAGVSSEFIHEMRGLQINEGLQLFSWHAFRRASPSPSYGDLSKRIVEACKGHPLSLEVIGALLYDERDQGCWTEALNDIPLIPDIQKTLYISYSALTEEEKQIFLDIACFFIGEAQTYPIMFWRCLYKKVHFPISNLCRKSLIKIGKKGVFDMHDHLRDMGRDIAKREGTRIWEAAQLNTVSNDINFSRLRLNGGNSQRLETLCRPGLRFLHLENLVIKDMLAMLPPSLIWLSLKNCSFVGGNIYHIFQYSLPNNIGNLSQLQHLKLKQGKILNNLPHTIGNLSQLQHLDLSWCIKLNNLPGTIGNLSQLQHLDLSWCTELNNLPDSIGNLSQLQRLDLLYCKKLNNLPNTIGNLTQLRYLNLNGCIELNNLPNTIGNLTQLRYLNLSSCIKLNNLPDTIGNLSQLQHLDLYYCSGLNNLPNTIGNLTQLRHLNLNRCWNLNNISRTIDNLSQQQHLNLIWNERRRTVIRSHWEREIESERMFCAWKRGD